MLFDISNFICRSYRGRPDREPVSQGPRRARLLRRRVPVDARSREAEEYPGNVGGPQEEYDCWSPADDSVVQRGLRRSWVQQVLGKSKTENHETLHG